MKIVVTGAEGFVGKKLVSECENRGTEVIGLDVQKGSRPGTHQADIRSKDLVQFIPPEADALVHLAGLTSDTDCKGRAHECFEMNVTGTLNVLRAAGEKKVKQFIFASSEWVYGDFEDGEIKDENSPIRVEDLRSEYALSKAVCEEYLKLKQAEDSMAVTILRFGIIYGSANGSRSAVESCFRDVQTRQEVTVGSLETGRFFIHVSDIVSGVLQSIGLRGFETLNLQGDRLIRLGEILDISKRLLSKDPKIRERTPDRPDIRRVSNEKAKRLLGWSPRVDLEEGLRGLMPRFEKPSARRENHGQR